MTRGRAPAKMTAEVVMGAPNLDPGHLFTRAWGVFKRRPLLAIAMWIPFAIVTGGGGGELGAGEIDQIPAAVVAVIGVLSLVFLLATLVIGGAIRAGFDVAMLRLIRGDDSVNFFDIFSGFQRFLENFVNNLLYFIAILVGLLACIVGVIPAAIGIFPIFVLSAERNVSGVEALKQSWALTKPHLGPLIVLALASLFLLIGGVLACCVGLLVAGPLVELMWLVAYDELTRAATAE